MGGDNEIKVSKHCSTQSWSGCFPRPAPLLPFWRFLSLFCSLSFISFLVYFVDLVKDLQWFPEKSCVKGKTFEEWMSEKDISKLLLASFKSKFSSILCFFFHLYYFSVCFVLFFMLETFLKCLVSLWHYFLFQIEVL